MDREKSIANYANVRMWISLAQFPCNFKENKVRPSDSTVGVETCRKIRIPHWVALIDESVCPISQPFRSADRGPVRS